MLTSEINENANLKPTMRSVVLWHHVAYCMKVKRVIPEHYRCAVIDKIHIFQLKTPPPPKKKKKKKAQQMHMY